MVGIACHQRSASSSDKLAAKASGYSVMSNNRSGLRISAKGLTVHYTEDLAEIKEKLPDVDKQLYGKLTDSEMCRKITK